MLGPTIPSGLSPAAFCSATVAACVEAPNVPSAVSGVSVEPVAWIHWLSAFCQATTSGPLESSESTAPVVPFPPPDDVDPAVVPSAFSSVFRSETKVDVGKTPPSPRACRTAFAGVRTESFQSLSLATRVVTPTAGEMLVPADDPETESRSCWRPSSRRSSTASACACCCSSSLGGVIARRRLMSSTVCWIAESSLEAAFFAVSEPSEAPACCESDAIGETSST